MLKARGITKWESDFGIQIVNLQRSYSDFESLKTLGKDELFDLFESAHIEGGKHLWRNRLYSVLKKKYSGFSKDVI